MSEQSDVVRELMADGVAVAVGSDGDIPVRWLAVVETINERGGRCMWRLQSDGMAAWEAISLHEYALTKLRGQIMREELMP